MTKSKEDTIRVKVYKSRVLRGGFRCPDTDNEYSPLWPKSGTGMFSREWCCIAQKAIIDENSDIYEATGRFSWGSGDEVSMPSKYYKLNTKTVR